MSRSTRQLLKWLAISGVVILAILWMVFAGGGSGGTLTNEVSESDWTKGNPESKIVLVEYSDFQCPACGNYYPIVKDVVAEFENHIQFVYRHFPLRMIHPNAQMASQGAEAAGMQDKFWEMHDMLFENQAAWSNLNSEEFEAELVTYAEDLGLDVEKFKTDLNSSAVKDAVDNTYNSGTAAGVNSTPTFFLNGQKINNPRSLEDFRTLIRQTLEESETI